MAQVNVTIGGPVYRMACATAKKIISCARARP